jgi:hypothetical protein
MTIQQACENAVGGNGSRFSVPNVTVALLGLAETHAAAPALVSLGKALSLSQYRRVSRALIRFAFFIQLVELPGVNTTRYRTRWTPTLAADDPRRASVEQCLDVLRKASELVLAAVNDPSDAAIFKTFIDGSKVTLELPIDYTERYSPALHSANNLVPIRGDLIGAVARLRSVLLSPVINPRQAAFGAAFEKIRTKSYLTDRVQTGLHKTNREWRWETPPNSVHFAFRRDCMEIEHALLSQLCRLHDLPADLATVLVTQGVRTDKVDPTRCPVTQDLLSYSALAKEMLEPSHGRSEFHVGHLNPLKATNDDPQSGHTAANISWISADGNRLQGHLGLKAVIELLQRIVTNYRSLGRPLG